MAPSKVILLACGSFNPPTNMHLRMFELARDNLNRLGQYLVIGGIVSPVHEAYGKKELIPGNYRCEMLKLALKSSDWIQISDWECSQETWSRTRRVLQYHQNLLNSVLSDRDDAPNNNQINDLENGYNYSSWITNDIRNTEGPVQIKLLCGADLLESFATPGLWADEDVENIIGNHGIVVITRQGSDPRRFIYESDILTKYQHNIIIVTEWITNDVSSTKVRRALRRQESVKYLLEDSVIDFIKKHKLYGTTKSNIKYDSNFNQNLNLPINTYILTPSPSDINVMLSQNSSVDNIYLTLNPILSENQNLKDATSSYNQNSNCQTFQSSEEYSSNKKQMDRNRTKEFQNLNQDVLIDFSNLDNTDFSMESKKKVGFNSKEKATEKNIVKVATETNRVATSTEIKEANPKKVQRRHSKKYPKTSEGKKLVRADSEKNDDEIHNAKENLVLRKSKSDAIMSKKGHNGETASVKIQFTKDGIKAPKRKKKIKLAKKNLFIGNKNKSQMK